MSEFDTLAIRLTEACTTRLGELGSYRPRNGAAKAVRMIVEHGVDILGEGGQVVDHRTVVSLAKADITDRVGAEFTDEAGAQYVCDAVVADDGEMVRLQVSPR